MNITEQNQVSTASSNVNQELKAGDKKKLKQACTDFEAVLLNSMFQAMRKTLSGEDVFGKSLGRDIYESMYYQELSGIMAEKGKGLGIGEVLYNQLVNRNTRTDLETAPTEF